MTRIMILTHSAAPAGAELALLHSLEVRGPDADVLVIFGEAGPMADRFSAAGIPCLVLPIRAGLAAARRGGGLPGLGQLAALVAYTRVIRREVRLQRADVVVGRSLKAAVYGRVATLGLPGRFVWCLHDRLTPDYLGRSHVLWSRVLSRLIDGVIVNSRSTLSTVHPGRRPVLVLPPAVASETRTTTQSRGGLRVLCLARLSPWKGQDIAIRAFAESLGGTDARLRIVGGALFGENDYARSLVALVDELGIADQVELTGQVEDPGAEVAASDVLLHASRIPEPFGAVVLEGMGAGCVVVATTPGGPAEMIQDGVTGLLAQIDSVDALARALRRVAAMTVDERTTMGAAARVRAAAYDPATMLAQQLAWLSALADGDPLPALTVAGPL